MSSSVASIDQLHDALERRIVVLDGAMGTMIQGLKLEEDGFRGDFFRDHPRSLKGCSDLLAMTQPDAITEIHLQFLRAGADIVETNTFTGTSISLEDYGLAHEARRINLAGAEAARRAAERAMKEDGKPR